MNNFTSIAIAMLEQLELLTAEEAKKLAKDLHGSTLPGTYEEASLLVSSLFKKYEVKLLAQKIAQAKKS